MGFPIGYTDIFIPPLFLHTLTLFTLFRNLLFSIFSSLGFSDFLDPYPSPSPPPTLPTHPPISAILTRQLLPIIKAPHVASCCSVCLYEVDSTHEIRFLSICNHVFHRECLDRWIDLDHYTCPLCRAPFLEGDLLSEFNQRLMFLDDIHLHHHDFDDCSHLLHYH